MNNTYRFLSDTEPTDEQLELLMTAVCQEVKERARIANEKHKMLMQEQLKLAMEQWKIIQSQQYGE